MHEPSLLYNLAVKAAESEAPVEAGVASWCCSLSKAGRFGFEADTSPTMSLPVAGGGSLTRSTGSGPRTMLGGIAGRENSSAAPTRLGNCDSWLVGCDSSSRAGFDSGNAAYRLATAAVDAPEAGPAARMTGICRCRISQEMCSSRLFRVMRSFAFPELAGIHWELMSLELEEGGLLCHYQIQVLTICLLDVG
jgi:hypothetical protein